MIAQIEPVRNDGHGEKRAAMFGVRVECTVSCRFQSRFIQPSETMAFGDNMNDAGMLLRADLSYAIGNARKEIKSLTRFVADTNLNDGVLQVLRTIR